MMGRAALATGLLAVLATGGLAGCAADDAAIEARLCDGQAQCPPGRACLEGACVLADADRVHVICQGAELRTVRVVCDDYRCDGARIDLLTQLDCSQPPQDACDGDRLVRQGPGTCDANLEACVYPPPRIDDCLATRVRCEGDLRVTDVGGGCDAEARRCRVMTTEDDCRARITGQPATCESGRFLSRSTLDDDVAACDPRTNACRTADVERIDCTADRVSCDGDTLRIERNGACLNNRCEAGDVQDVDCSLAPDPQCDGDLRIRRGPGGVCDPAAAACRYPDPTVEDCAREQATCVAELSSVRPATTCRDGACVDPPTVTDCTADLPTECLDGEAPSLRLHPGGVCERGSGRCVYPDPVIEPCPSVFACEDNVSRSEVPLSCEGGVCVNRSVETACDAPSGYCLDGVAHNYDRADRCDPAAGRCIGPDVAADRSERCPDELFCRDNRLFGPDEPNCVVDDGVAECRALELLDCNRAPAPTCDGSRRVAHPGPGVCNAVRGCDFGATETTDCAACLPGAVCVLPGTVRLPAAAVDMGSADAPLPARYDAALVMSTTEVTRGEVEALVGEGLLPPLLGEAPAGCDGACPATGLSWIDAVAIANARSVQDRLTPCYDPLGRVVGGADGDPFLCEGWRLPTEVEWLAAWRDGAETRWPCGDDPACLGPQDGGLNSHLSAATPRPVGRSARHGPGLYDLGGNAREWMHDAFAPLTGGREPYGPADGTMRVLRGGSWLTDAAAAEATARSGAPAHERVPDAGLRLVRSLAPRPPAFCQTDPVTEQSNARVYDGRGSCALTPGVPCAYDLRPIRCPAGCRDGRCLREGDLLINAVHVDGIDPDIDEGDDPNGGEGGGGRGGEPEPPPGEDEDEGPFLPIPMQFAEIPAGVLTHGRGADARRTIIAHDFYLMTTELAYVQFAFLLGERGLQESDFARLVMRNLLFEQLEACRENPTTCLTLPAFGLSWLDAVRIANNLSRSEGLPSCYDDTGLVIDGVDGDPQTCIGYRLPTEAEWVYAARAGGTTAFECGDDPVCLGQSAAYRDNSGVEVDDPADCPCRGQGCPLWSDDGICRFPQPVDGTPENAWGLIGMSGNVAEWVADFGDGSGPAVGGRDPYRGPARDLRPVLKGGAWYDSSAALRLDARALPAGEVFPGVAAGVRLARTIPAAELPTVRIEGPRSAGDVTVSGDFEITAHEMTRQAAAELGAQDVSLFGDCGADCSINWIERGRATAVANALSVRHGLQPCYARDGGVRASADDDPYRCEGWRLPTEAEWRVLAPCDAACALERGWTLCSSSYPDDADDLSSEVCTCDAALYAATVDACGFPADALPHPACAANGAPACFGPRPVGQRPMDGDGLYDRAGNLREYLHDRWSADPPTGVDPYGPADDGAVLCGDQVRDCFTVVGGSWADAPEGVETRRPQHAADDRTGFRLVRSLPDDGGP